MKADRYVLRQKVVFLARKEGIKAAVREFGCSRNTVRKCSQDTHVDAFIDSRLGLLVVSHVVDSVLLGDQGAHPAPKFRIDFNPDQALLDRK